MALGEPRRRGGVSRRLLGLLLLAPFALVVLIALSGEFRRSAALGLAILALAALGYAAIHWGYDSRDGSDWKVSGGRPRSPL